MNFIKQFIAARAVSTPIISVRTSDAASTITNVRKALVIGLSNTAAKELINKTPIVVWDAIHGLVGKNDKGSAEVASMIAKIQVDAGATTQLPIALSALEYASED